jgi:hypothetical protein
MATTTNYGFEIPDDTDLVKDGALAMRDLGQDVDTQLFTALGGDYPGLRLVKKQTIGTAVSSITVTDAFSATYENYKIMVGGGTASTATNFNMTLGASATGYYSGLTGVVWATAAAQLVAQNNATSWLRVGSFQGGQSVNIDIQSPFLATNTAFQSSYLASNYSAVITGQHQAATSFTSFTLTTSTGTLTGGTIYVYGYGTS